jgi:hypothetical protein
MKSRVTWNAIADSTHATTYVYASTNAGIFQLFVSR